MTTTYSLSVFNTNTESTIFDGIIRVNNTTKLVTGVFETINGTTDYESNLLIPTGTGENQGLGPDGFTYYRIPDFFEVGSSVRYDNVYVKGWKQFDSKGLIFSGMSLYPYYTNINLFASESGDQTENRTATILAKNTDPDLELAEDDTKVSLDVEVFITDLTPPGPTPVSNICFLRNTPINTDQGKIFIENIDPNRHTIHNKKIVAITKTVTNEKYLVCFEKDSLAINYPNKKTVISKHHKVKYNGQMIPAYKFVDQFPHVNKIKYNGEILYNVLMENYDMMRVNNMICETLHPENILAKIHNSTLSRDAKNQIIVKMNNEYLKKSNKRVVTK